MSGITRKHVLRVSPTSGALAILPSGPFANTPNSLFNFVDIGVRRQGKSDVMEMREHKRPQLLAVCDADLNSTKDFKDVPECRDYSKMFSASGGKVDAVVRPNIMST